MGRDAHLLGRVLSRPMVAGPLSACLRLTRRRASDSPRQASRRRILAPKGSHLDHQPTTTVRVRTSPRHFDDDGSVITVDLHGCSVDDALYIIRRSIQEAYHRGRTKVDVIHGGSTSTGTNRDRSIKNELQKAIDRGMLSQWTSGHASDPSGGRTAVWIKLGMNRNPARIRLRDVAPP